MRSGVFYPYLIITTGCWFRILNNKKVQQEILRTLRLGKISVLNLKKQKFSHNI